MAQPDGEDADALKMKMIQAAMLEELGAGRLDSLPLEDRGYNGIVPAARVHALSQNRAAATNPWQTANFTDGDRSLDDLDNIADGQLYRLRRGVSQGNRGGGRAGSAGRGGRRGRDHKPHFDSQTPASPPSIRHGNSSSAPQVYFNDARRGGTNSHKQAEAAIKFFRQAKRSSSFFNANAKKQSSDSRSYLTQYTSNHRSSSPSVSVSQSIVSNQPSKPATSSASRPKLANNLSSSTCARLEKENAHLAIRPKQPSASSSADSHNLYQTPTIRGTPTNSVALKQIAATKTAQSNPSSAGKSADNLSALQTATAAGTSEASAIVKEPMEINTARPSVASNDSTSRDKVVSTLKIQRNVKISKMGEWTKIGNVRVLKDSVEDVVVILEIEIQDQLLLQEPIADTDTFIIGGSSITFKATSKGGLAPTWRMTFRLPHEAQGIWNAWNFVIKRTRRERLSEEAIAESPKPSTIALPSTSTSDLGSQLMSVSTVIDDPELQKSPTLLSLVSVHSTPPVDFGDVREPKDLQDKSLTSLVQISIPETAVLSGSQVILQQSICSANPVLDSPPATREPQVVSDLQVITGKLAYQPNRDELLIDFEHDEEVTEPISPGLQDLMHLTVDQAAISNILDALNSRSGGSFLKRALGIAKVDYDDVNSAQVVTAAEFLVNEFFSFSELFHQLTEEVMIAYVEHTAQKVLDEAIAIDNRRISSTAYDSLEQFGYQNADNIGEVQSLIAFNMNQTPFTHVSRVGSRANYGGTKLVDTDLMGEETEPLSIFVAKPMQVDKSLALDNPPLTDDLSGKLQENDAAPTGVKEVNEHAERLSSQPTHFARSSDAPGQINAGERASSTPSAVPSWTIREMKKSLLSSEESSSRTSPTNDASSDISSHDFGSPGTKKEQEHSPMFAIMESTYQKFGEISLTPILSNDPSAILDQNHHGHQVSPQTNSSTSTIKDEKTKKPRSLHRTGLSQSLEDLHLNLHSQDSSKVSRNMAFKQAELTDRLLTNAIQSSSTHLETVVHGELTFIDSTAIANLVNQSASMAEASEKPVSAEAETLKFEDSGEKVAAGQNAKDDEKKLKHQIPEDAAAEIEEDKRTQELLPKSRLIEATQPASTSVSMSQGKSVAEKELVLPRANFSANSVFESAAIGTTSVVANAATAPALTKMEPKEMGLMKQPKKFLGLASSRFNPENTSLLRADYSVPTTLPDYTNPRFIPGSVSANPATGDIRSATLVPRAPITSKNMVSRYTPIPSSASVEFQSSDYQLGYWEGRKDAQLANPSMVGSPITPRGTILDVTNYPGPLVNVLAMSLSPPTQEVIVTQYPPQYIHDSTQEPIPTHRNYHDIDSPAFNLPRNALHSPSASQNVRAEYSPHHATVNPARGNQENMPFFSFSSSSTADKAAAVFKTTDSDQCSPLTITNKTLQSRLDRSMSTRQLSSDVAP